jgi:predicted N-acyltransferase
MIDHEQWEAIRPQQNPFLGFEFIDALMKSGSVSQKTGWDSLFFKKENAALMTFSKTHSYGEYIFDWSWAEAFKRYGFSYYPKLTSMIPFTPVTTQHFLMSSFHENLAHELLEQHDQYMVDHQLSSAHFLFLSPEEKNVFLASGYMMRESIQYHFFNQNFDSFEGFLSSLKTKKAKNILLERKHQDLKITRYTGDDLTCKHSEDMYSFYLSTIVNKNSFDYLNEAFFNQIFRTMKNNLLYVEATREGQVMAGSLFFYDHEKIYGRYWGSREYIPNLHFELCYYQGIEFCIENKLKTFEAGAQGEHKIARGLRPVRIYSAHKIRHKGFQASIHDFILREKTQVQMDIDNLSLLLPYKISE